MSYGVTTTRINPQTGQYESVVEDGQGGYRPLNAAEQGWMQQMAQQRQAYAQEDQANQAIAQQRQNTGDFAGVQGAGTVGSGPANPYMPSMTTQPAPMAKAASYQPQQPQMPQMGPGQFTANPYTGMMANDIARRSGNFLNQQVMPAINRGAVANGTYGSSRQGIAQGLAASGAADALQGNLANLFSGQFNADRNYGLQSDALDLNAYNANQTWMRQGQQDQLNTYDKLLNWNQQYGLGNATNAYNTPMNYWQQFSNTGAQLGGMGGTNTQNMQGNPWLGALGGAMTGISLYNNWGK